uniref:Uncharacterized protein n=1 Tax=Heliothis virescens TaxID=7102 RepID=A0A2A4JQE3_HELVI
MAPFPRHPPTSLGPSSSRDLLTRHPLTYAPHPSASASSATRSPSLAVAFPHHQPASAFTTPYPPFLWFLPPTPHHYGRLQRKKPPASHMVLLARPTTFSTFALVEPDGPDDSQTADPFGSNSPATQQTIERSALTISTTTTDAASSVTLARPFPS